jgi:predicted chitinase
MNFYYGVVENRSDPLRLGRCQVRVVGLHTHDKSQLPTMDLPWAVPVQPVTSAAMNGIGQSPVGPVEGTSVIIIFADDHKQQPILLGTLGGIPNTPVPVDADDNGSINTSVKITDLKLRTIPGPTTGKQITFYDPENGATNLTSPLKANMKVIGFGIPSETTIVSIDSGTKITISKPVVKLEENIISFEDAPTNLSAVAESRVFDSAVRTGSGSILTSSDGTPVTTSTSTVKPSSANDSIPTIPPPKTADNQVLAVAGIKALIAACDKVGLTTKEQKCALLGIAGGESKWIPRKEDYIYSAGRMKEIFSFATDADVAKYSDAKKKGISREEFFSWAYGITKRGANFLGNKTDADGGKYYGRGFIQLTGRDNYTRYQKVAAQYGITIDLVNNPDSLNDDLNVSAIVAALYIKDRVPAGVSPSKHPDYFYAAKSSVGKNSPDIAAAKKSYYEYFYGKPDAGGVEKSAGAPLPEPPKDTKDPTPRPSDESIKTGSNNIGFRDPNNKYPLKEYIGEPDTNRLARGIIEGTVIGKKDAVRKLTVPKGLELGSWDQPQSAYGAQYPYNKVLETEAGHIQEFDDTPGYERIHTFHRSGTFTEIDPTGTQVNYIVGDNYTIMDRNGCITVSGELNITVNGNANIYARTDANVHVENNATVRVGSNANIGVANDLTLAVGNDMKVKVAGALSFDAGSINVKSQAAFNMQSVAGLSLKGSTVNVESEGDANYLSGGKTSMDYSEGQFGNGAAGATAVDNVTLTPPSLGSPLSPVIPYTTPPERQFESNAHSETPEMADTPEARAAQHDSARKEGVPNAPAAVPAEVAPPIAKPSANAKEVPVDCKIIYTTTNFTDDFRLSKNFTLGMLIDGGVGGKHKLVDQMLREIKDGPERLYKVQEIVCNMAMMAQNLLEPALDVLPGGIGGFRKQWTINSGYRLRGVVGNESPVSDHPKGRAVDIGILLNDRTAKTYEYIQKLEKVIPYDQLILEYRYPSSVWIHTSYNKDSKRKQAFTMVNDSTFKRDAKGMPAGFVLVDNIPPKNKPA